jgi:hypothetical protein
MGAERRAERKRMKISIVFRDHAVGVSGRFGPFQRHRFSHCIWLQNNEAMLVATQG